MLENLLVELSPDDQLDGEDIQNLEVRFKERAFKAIESVANDTVTFYQFKPSGREIWGVVSFEDPAKTHLILRQTQCDCLDFYLRTVIRREQVCCYHLLAVELAVKLRKYTTIMAGDEEYYKTRRKFKL